MTRPMQQLYCPLQQELDSIREAIRQVQQHSHKDNQSYHHHHDDDCNYSIMISVRSFPTNSNRRNEWYRLLHTLCSTIRALPRLQELHIVEDRLLLQQVPTELPNNNNGNNNIVDTTNGGRGPGHTQYRQGMAVEWLLPLLIRPDIVGLHLHFRNDPTVHSRLGGPVLPSNTEWQWAYWQLHLLHPPTIGCIRSCLQNLPNLESLSIDNTDNDNSRRPLLLEQYTVPPPPTRVVQEWIQPMDQLLLTTLQTIPSLVKLTLGSWFVHSTTLECLVQQLNTLRLYGTILQSTTMMKVGTHGTNDNVPTIEWTRLLRTIETTKHLQELEIHPSFHPTSEAFYRYLVTESLSKMRGITKLSVGWAYHLSLPFLSSLGRAGHASSIRELDLQSFSTVVERPQRVVSDNVKMLETLTQVLSQSGSARIEKVQLMGLNRTDYSERSIRRFLHTLFLPEQQQQQQQQCTTIRRDRNEANPSTNDYSPRTIHHCAVSHVVLNTLDDSTLGIIMSDMLPQTNTVQTVEFQALHHTKFYVMLARAINVNLRLTRVSIHLGTETQPYLWKVIQKLCLRNEALQRTIMANNQRYQDAFLALVLQRLGRSPYPLDGQLDAAYTLIGSKVGLLSTRKDIVRVDGEGNEEEQEDRMDCGP